MTASASQTTTNDNNNDAANGANDESVVSPENERTNKFDGLPIELMHKILCFVDISTRVKLVSCNKALQERIFREIRWTLVDFTTMSTDAARDRLTDADLSSFLEMINPREVTEVLGVYGCKRVLGDVLKPLKYSNVLVHVDLEETMVDQCPVKTMRILRTMFCNKLSRVDMHPSVWIQDSGAREFFWELSETRRERAQTQQTPCSCCNKPIVPMGIQTIPGINGFTAFDCQHCGKVFCGQGSCPTSFNNVAPANFLVAIHVTFLATTSRARKFIATDATHFSDALAARIFVVMVPHASGNFRASAPLLNARVSSCALLVTWTGRW